eukprot:Clim_evm6s253 gene=Clim_evmTU6s253
MSHGHSHSGGCSGGGGHGHSHGGGSHGHSHDDPERGFAVFLRQYIDFPKVRAMNEAEDGSAKTIFRPWEERITGEGEVESDVDEELLIYVPFTGEVTLKSIALLAEAGDKHPSTMKVFINRDDIDFGVAQDLQPLQSWDLVNQGTDVLEYETSITKFKNVHSLTFYFPDNNGAETTKLRFIGLKGIFHKVTRDTIITTVYEASANPADHKAESDKLMGGPNSVS